MSYYPNDGIDPEIHRISQAQQASRNDDQMEQFISIDNALTDNFNHDLELATTRPERPVTPDNFTTAWPQLDAHTLSFQHQTWPDTPPSTNYSWQSPQHRKLLEVQRASANFNLFQQQYTPSQRQWQQNNPYAVLADLPTQHDGDDPSTLDYHAHPNNTYAAPSQFGTPLQDGFQPRVDNYNFGDAMLNVPTLRLDNNTVQDQPNTIRASISSENLSRLPVHPQSNESMGQWSDETFQSRLVKAMPPGPSNGQNPPTPASSVRRGRRASKASTIATVSTQPQAFSCDKCGKSFDKRHRLNHHYRWHDDPTHTCEECGKAFVAKKDLKRHINIHKKEERHIFCNQLGCPYQHKGFQRKDHWKRHNKTMHGIDTNLLSPPAASPFANG